MTEKVKMERDGELKEQWNGMRLGGGRGMMQFVQVRERGWPWKGKRGSSFL